MGLPLDRANPRTRLRVRAVLGGRSYELRWASGNGPQETITLYPGKPVKALVVARLTTSELTKFCPWPSGDRHVVLATGVAYLADDQLLVHRTAKHTLPDGPILKD